MADAAVTDREPKVTRTAVRRAYGIEFGQADDRTDNG
jgi:hypothetical protein